MSRNAVLLVGPAAPRAAAKPTTATGTASPAQHNQALTALPTACAVRPTLIPKPTGSTDIRAGLTVRQRHCMRAAPAKRTPPAALSPRSL